MNLSRRSLIAGLLFCLPLFGTKNKKKLYIKFKKSDGYNCIDPKTKYKSSFKVIPDWEYELVDFKTTLNLEPIFKFQDELKPYEVEKVCNTYTIVYNNQEICINTSDFNFEIVEK